jgi:amidophosphoribosyltransferase
LPYTVGLVKNRYVGRTFIQTTQAKREKSVSIKLNALSSAVKGKRVIMVDDSIVRGTTCAYIVSLLREAGAKEVHMRVSSPPFLHRCYYGTDIPNEEVLAAHNRTVDDIVKLIGADSLMYLDLQDIADVMKDLKCGYCDACFTGNNPVPVPNDAEYTSEGRIKV